MKERLKKFLSYLGIGQNKFATTVGLSKGYFGRAGNNPTSETIDKILKTYPELNRDWLLTGEGEMLKQESNNITQKGMGNAASIYGNATAGKLAHKDEEIAILKARLKDKEEIIALLKEKLKKQTKK
jgi:transcriptional regulator with XRE-family HTH domain